MDQFVEPEKGGRLPRQWNWVDILLMALSSSLVIVLGSWLLVQALQSGLSPESGFTLVYTASLTALEAVGLFLGVMVFGLWRRHLSWQAVGFKPVSTSWLLWAAVTAVLFIPIIGLIALAIQVALGLPLENPQLEFLAPADISWYGILAMVVFGGFIVPIAEEVFFRGVLYRWMRQSLRMWPAILISSAIFGALHGDIAVGGATFVMGILLAWFYERSGSLWAPISIHIINNASKLILLYVMLASGIQLPTIV